MHLSTFQHNDPYTIAEREPVIVLLEKDLETRQQCEIVNLQKCSQMRVRRGDKRQLRSQLLHYQPLTSQSSNPQPLPPQLSHSQLSHQQPSEQQPLHQQSSVQQPFEQQSFDHLSLLARVRFPYARFDNVPAMVAIVIADGTVDTSTIDAYTVIVLDRSFRYRFARNL